MYKKTKKNKVIFCTYQSAKKVVDALKNNRADLAVFDEAHHVTGRFDKKAVILLDNNQIKITNRLFMTATPKMCSDDDASLVVADMNNEQLFGKVAYQLSFKQAIQENILCDYQLLAATVTKDDIRRIKGKHLTKSEKVSASAIKKCIEDGSISRGITFHNRKKSASKFSKVLNAVLDDVFADTLNSSHSLQHRINSINKLKRAERGILTNVRVLGEGFDYSALDFVVFVDEKKSTTEIIQNIGRVMRKDNNNNNKIGTVIIPLLIDNSNDDVTLKIEENGFLPVYKIATALGLLDSILGSEIAISRGTADSINTTYLLSHVKLRKGAKLSKQAVIALKEKVRMYSLYGSDAARRERNNTRIDELLKFCERHNRLPLRDSEDKKETELFSFYLRQNTLSSAPELRESLKRIRDIWGKNTKTINFWDDKTAFILEYHMKHNRLPVNAGTAINGVIQKIRDGKVPECVVELLNDRLEKIKTFKGGKEVVLEQFYEKITGLEEWAEIHGKLPSKSDDKEFSRLIRNRNVIKSEEGKRRIQSVFNKFRDKSEGLYSTKGLDKKTKREETYKRNKEKFIALEAFIKKHKKLPRKSDDKKLNTFMASRSSSVTCLERRELINELIERNKHILEQGEKAS